MHTFLNSYNRKKGIKYIKIVIWIEMAKNK